jgi:hypothetical protein
MVASLVEYIVAFFGYTINTVPTPPYHLCVASTNLAGQVVVYTLILCQVVPSIMQLICNAVLAMRILTALNQRSRLSASDNQSGHTISMNEISAAITLIIVSCLHIVIYLPAGCLMYLNIVLPIYGLATNAVVLEVYYGAATLALLESAAAATNFLSYLFRIRSFRQRCITTLTCNIVRFH